MTFKKFFLTLCVGLSLGALTTAQAQVDIPPPPPNLGPLPAGPAPPTPLPLPNAPQPEQTGPEIPQVTAADATIITVDAAANRHPINPLIYSVAYWAYRGPMTPTATTPRRRRRLQMTAS